MSSTARPELASARFISRIRTALPTTGWNGKRGERARRSPTPLYPAAAAASRYSSGGASGSVVGESAIRLTFTGTGSYTLSGVAAVVYPLGAGSLRVGPSPSGARRRSSRGWAPPTEARLQSEEACMFFELRQYHIRPGQRDKWVRCMEEEIIPFQVKMGMVILGSFVGEEDESVYVWIRRFENEQERKRLYDLVYQSDYWKNEIAPRVPTLIDREQIKVTRLVATPRSVIQ